MHSVTRLTLLGAALVLMLPVSAMAQTSRERERERARREAEREREELERAREERERAREARDRARDERDRVRDDRDDDRTSRITTGRSGRDTQDWLEDCRDQDWGDRDQERFCEVREMGWRGPGRALVVDASPNGGVRIEGWDRDSVHVELRIQAVARSEADAREIARDVRATRRGDELVSDGPSDLPRRSWWSISYVIMVPRTTDLTLETVNGPLTVDDVNSRMNLRVQNGPLALRRVGGDVTARAQNGPLAVELEGSEWRGTGLDASTQNGPLVLEIPEGYNAELETGTINGPMTLGFPVTVQGRLGAGARRHLTTTLGRGGARIRATTTNGPAVIRRS